MRNIIKRIPVIFSITKIFYFTFIQPFRSFPGSEDYWRQRYKLGETSGSGSYQELAKFKAEVLNEFVRNKQIKTVIEYGCGDGNQLKLSEYPLYIGFDVSPEAISLCKHIFSNDNTKTFKLMDEYDNETAELTLSLDVIYHLIEEAVFFAYMERLFDSSIRFVIIYSSNSDKQAWLQASHVRHRNFSKWIEQNKQQWKLIKHIPNRYPYLGNEQEGSFADFYIYEKEDLSERFQGRPGCH